MSAREEVLLSGLIDWVALQRIHSRVARENSTEPLSVICRSDQEDPVSPQVARRRSSR
jgi:hypothetical protein